MKSEKEQLLLEIAIQNQDIIFRDNKILAKTNWLRLWEDNPRFVEEKDLSRLKTQMKELGIYKPLLVCLGNNYGLVLGGNQRLKILQELAQEDENYKYVWISLIEASTYEERLKFALSDNDTIGKYSREKVLELIKPLSGQENLFNDYKLSDKTIQNYLEEIELTESELKLKQLKKELIENGISEEIAENILTIGKYNKAINRLQNIDIEGGISNERKAIIFWVDNEQDWKFLNNEFKLLRKGEWDTEKLISLINYAKEE